MGQGDSRSIPISDRKIVRLHQLAEGAYGFVDLAEDKRSKQRFALKRILAQDDETNRVAMLEIDVLTKLNPHPHIVILHGSASRAVAASGSNSLFSTAPPAAGASLRREYYILMEYCSKGTLSQALAARQQANRPYAEKELLSVFLAVCAAVEHMHSHGIVHRDLKPENVLINDDNELKLCDFGSCTYDSKVYSTPAEIGQLEEQVQKYSTATYRAPEQVDIYARKLVGKPVDVWALGCILFVMCYFELPFPTGSAAQISSASYRIPAMPRYSPALVGLIRSMFTVDPVKRPSVTDVIASISEILRAPAYVPTNEPDAVVSPNLSQAKAKQSSKVTQRRTSLSPLSLAPLQAVQSQLSASAAPPSDWDAFGDDTDESKPAVNHPDPAQTSAIDSQVAVKSNEDDEFDAFQSASP